VQHRRFEFALSCRAFIALNEPQRATHFRSGLFSALLGSLLGSILQMSHEFLGSCAADESRNHSNPPSEDFLFALVVQAFPHKKVMNSWAYLRETSHVFLGFFPHTSHEFLGSFGANDLHDTGYVHWPCLAGHAPQMSHKLGIRGLLAEKCGSFADVSSFCDVPLSSLIRVRDL